VTTTASSRLRASETATIFSIFTSVLSAMAMLAKMAVLTASVKEAASELGPPNVSWKLTFGAAMQALALVDMAGE